MCEIVFLFNASLVEDNQLKVIGPPFTPAQITMRDAKLPDGALKEAQDVAATVLDGLGAEPVAGNNLSLKKAILRGVAHQAGSLRVGANAEGVLDSDMKFLAYDNLYACDKLSIRLFSSRQPKSDPRGARPF